MLSSIPRAIWTLGFVSLLMDASSEMIHSLLPLFLVSTLGASVTSVGFIQGVAESAALLFKLFSGTLSDFFQRRKALTLVGYSLSALTKPFFPLANTVSLVFSARLVDRIGKGIREAPRDALIADLAPPKLRGACFGLRQALDTVGALIGPLVAAIALMFVSTEVRWILWIASIPALGAVLLLAFGVPEPQTHADSSRQIAPSFRFRDIGQAGRAYWQLLVVAAALTLSRFSEAFILLKASSLGLPLSFIPLVMVVSNGFYALSAYPAGALSDRLGRAKLLQIGLLILVAGQATFGMATSWLTLGLGACLWGLHLGATKGILAAQVVDTAPAHLRGTAFGLFNLVCGLATLISNIIAGLLWDRAGPMATFAAGATFAALSLALYSRSKQPSSS